MSMLKQQRYILLAWLLVSLSQLHAAEDASWQKYYQRSVHLQQVDKHALTMELKSHNLTQYSLPKATRHFGFDINAPLSWYQTTEGRAVAEAMLSFQTPSGGWSKRTDMTVTRRAGQHWGVEPKYVPTFDNSATTTQLRILAKAYTATADPRFKKAFYRGMQLILQAQYPNGGWPQNYPLTGDYHDHITLNDEVTEEILSLLLAIIETKPAFSFVDNTLKHAAEQALHKGVALILRIQQRDKDGLSLWAAQYEHRSLMPAWARAYEMPALAVMESASLLEVLMQLPAPSKELQHAIHSGSAWLKRHAIFDKHWHRHERVLQDRTGVGPLWPRFAELDSNRPIFGDRDNALYYDVHEVSLERRQGYAWYTERPAQTLQHYQTWQQRFPISSPTQQITD